MDFKAVFELLIKCFKKEGIDFALIGGFAVQASGYTRATQDIDLLVMKRDAPKIKEIMLSYGYEMVHETDEISMFVGKIKKMGEVDFMHAHRKYAMAMLQNAQYKDILNGKFKIKVIRPEDLIGLKVQSSFNNKDRYHHDMADVEAVLKANKGRLDIALIKEYFDLFGRGDEFKQIMERLDNA